MSNKRKTTDGLDTVSTARVHLAKTTLTSNASVLRSITFPDVDGTVMIEDSGGLDLSQPLKLIAGSPTTPSLTFTGDPNTGLYNNAADSISISTGGVQTLRVSNTDVRLMNTKLAWATGNTNYDPNANPTNARSASMLHSPDFQNVTDTTTAQNGTVALRFDNFFGYKIANATNTGITYTDSATVYINGAPTHSGVTATRTYGLLMGSSAPLGVAKGGVSANGICFNGVGVNTGIHYNTGNGVNLTANGVLHQFMADRVTLGTALRGVSGTAAAPGYTYASDTTSGNYLIGAGNVGTSISGVRVADINSTRLSLTGNLALEKSGFSSTLSQAALTGNQTITIPATGNDTLMTLGSTQDVTGTKTFTTAKFSGNGTNISNIQYGELSNSVFVSGQSTTTVGFISVTGYSSLPCVLLTLVTPTDGSGNWDNALLFVNGASSTASSIEVRLSNNGSSGDINGVAKVKWMTIG